MGSMQRLRACERDAPPLRCDREANEKWWNRVHRIRILAFFVRSMDPDIYVFEHGKSASPPKVESHKMHTTQAFQPMHYSGVTGFVSSLC